MQVTAPAAHYRDTAVWAREREAVFARAWRLVGLERDAAAPGDWIADDLAGYPVVVIRGKDGMLRAFHNVCRHRAGPLVDGAVGHCEGRLVCRYHGWVYALDGRLRSATGFGAVDGFDPRDFGLFPLQVQTWRGFVFVNAGVNAPPLADDVAPLEALWRDGDYTLPAAATRRSHSIACDWKVYVENYLEGYHVEGVHPGLAAQVDAAAYAVEVRGRVVVQQAPARDGSAQEGVWAYLWPNLAFNLYRTGVMVEHMRPDGFGRTRLDYLYFHAPEADMAETLRFSDQITAEDAAICEAVQRNLDAGVYDRGVLSPRHEQGVAWFQAEVAAAMARTVP